MGSVYFCNDDKDLQDLIYDKDNRLKRSFVDFFIGGKKGRCTQNDSLRWHLQHCVLHYSRCSMRCARSVLLHSFASTGKECMKHWSRFSISTKAAARVSVAP